MAVTKAAGTWTYEDLFTLPEDGTRDEIIEGALYVLPSVGWAHASVVMNLITMLIPLADSPGRHQPGTGEINFRFLLGELEDAGYSGWVCPEYRPLGGTETSLAWMREWTARA